MMTAAHISQHSVAIQSTTLQGVTGYQWYCSCTAMGDAPDRYRAAERANQHLDAHVSFGEAPDYIHIDNYSFLHRFNSYLVHCSCRQWKMELSTREKAAQAWAVHDKDVSGLSKPVFYKPELKPADDQVFDDLIDTGWNEIVDRALPSPALPFHTHTVSNSSGIIRPTAPPGPEDSKFEEQFFVGQSYCSYLTPARRSDLEIVTSPWSSEKKIKAEEGDCLFLPEAAIDTTQFQIPFSNGALANTFPGRIDLASYGVLDIHPSVQHLAYTTTTYIVAYWNRQDPSQNFDHRAPK